MSDEDDISQKTLAVHGGEPRTYPYDALAAPITQTATYSFADTAELIAYFEGRKDREEYGRYGNPSVRLVEEKMAALERTEDAVAFASGMAAVTSTILALVKSGAHVILFADCYRRTRQFVTTFLDRFGVSNTLIPPADVEALAAAIRPETRLVIAEAPTNPYQTVPDLEQVAEICRERKVKTLIDSTFATPVNFKPASYGIDIVVHSATKYLAGHNDVLGGVVAGKAGLVSLVRDLRSVFGAMPRPARGLSDPPRHQDLGASRRTAKRIGAGACRAPRAPPSGSPGVVSGPAISSQPRHRETADERVWGRRDVRGRRGSPRHQSLRRCVPNPEDRAESRRR